MDEDQPKLPTKHAKALRKAVSSLSVPSLTSDEMNGSPKLHSNNNVSFLPKEVPRTVVLRFILILSLLSAVSICASVSYIMLRNTELEVGRQTYEGIAASALAGAHAITFRKVQGSEVMATLLSHLVPESSSWPMINIGGYSPTSDKVARLSSSLTQSLVVLVEPSQALEFEQHAWNVYRSEGRPLGAGMSDFGFGIWKSNDTSGFADNRSHDISGETSWNATRSILAPIMLHNLIDAPSILFNTYSEADRGMHIDSIFDCVKRNPDPSVSPACAVITNMLEMKVRPGPAAQLFQPIFPANEPNHFVGFAITSIHWQEVLTNVVPNYVDGLICVVSTATRSFSYKLVDGEPQLVGEGDLHDTKYTKHARSIVLNDIATGVLSSTKYTLTVYPTDRMFNAFSTNSPLSVALGFFGVIAACTCVFFLYDYFMRYEAQRGKTVLEIKRRFVRFISHEIRTPLNTVCMGLELMESELNRFEIVKASEDQVDDDGGNFLHNVAVDIKENANVAVAILNDLLNYDKLETGAFKLELGRVYIWDLIQRTVNQFRIQAMNKRVDLELNIETPNMRENADDPVDVESCTFEDYATLNVIGDDMRLSQVLRNVISNALKFSPPKSSITVMARHNPLGLAQAKSLLVDGRPACSHPRAGSIEVIVKDHGVGLTKDQLDMLFTEGVQFDANRLQHGGGSGLGLSIAKGIVEQHCGTIRAESEGHNYGASFHIELPLYKFPFDDNLEEKESSMPRTLSATSVQTLSEAIRSHHVLVVEDAESSRKMLVRLLERAGHTCVATTNGAEAVEAMIADLQSGGGFTIDTILMDFEMPVLKGPDAAHEIRELGFRGTILGVTGNVLSEDVEYFISRGADEVLAKPISLDRIKAFWENNF